MVNVSWTSVEPTQGYVAYGLTPELGSTTRLEASPGLTHSVGLLGLTPDTPYFYQVITWDGDDAAASDVASVRSGVLQAGVQATTTGTSPGDYTLSAVNGATTRAVIHAPDGALVWSYADPQARLIKRARFAKDGTSILYSASFDPPAAESEIVRVALDGSLVTPTAVPLLTGDFVETADGTLAALVSESRDSVTGDAIVEVTAGVATSVWSAWDCFDPAVDVGDGGQAAWTAASGIDYDPVQDAYYVGLRNLSVVAKVTRTGTCEWVVGQNSATVSFAVGTEPFTHPSQFQVFGDRLLVFDEAGSASGPRIIEYQLDLMANTATQVWTYPAPAGATGGEPTRLLGNATRISWGSAGLNELVSPAGESTWTLSLGEPLGFGDFAEDLYAPGK